MSHLTPELAPYAGIVLPRACGVRVKFSAHSSTLSNARFGFFGRGLGGSGLGGFGLGLVSFICGLPIASYASREGGHVRARERAGRQPRYRRLAHAIGARKIGLRSTFRKALDGLMALVRSEDRRTTKFDSTSLCTGSALTRAGTDELTLELGNAGKHRDQQPAVRRSGIGPTRQPTT